MCIRDRHGDGAILAGFLNILAEFEARAEAYLLHFQIAARQRQFLAQRNALAPAQAEAAPQEEPGPIRAGILRRTPARTPAWQPGVPSGSPSCLLYTSDAADDLT